MPFSNILLLLHYYWAKSDFSRLGIIVRACACVLVVLLLLREGVFIVCVR